MRILQFHFWPLPVLFAGVALVGIALFLYGHGRGVYGHDRGVGVALAPAYRVPAPPLRRYVFAPAAIVVRGPRCSQEVPHVVFLVRRGAGVAAVPAAALPAADVPAAAPPPGALAPAIGDDDVGRAIECRDGRCTIARRLVNQLLANPVVLASAARFLPSASGGFRVVAIRPASILDRLGLKNGDRLKTLNGTALTTPAALIDAALALHDASRLLVQLERRGAAVALDYAIR